MNISEIFIRRPIMTTLLMIALFLFGVLGFKGLPVSDLPNVDFPTIQVSASLPGASPETMASSVATPLEREFSTIAGIDSMTSSSTLGKVSITIQFNLNRNIDSAAADVQAAISAVNRSLPKEMTSPPTYHKVNPAEAPILYLSLRGATVPLSQLNLYGETLLAQRISTVNGVAQVNVYGSQKYAVRVLLDPDLLAARDVSVTEVSDAIHANNANLPTGTLNTPKQSFLIQADGQLKNATSFRKLIVAYKNGAPIHLDQVADVIDGVANTKAAGWYNNERSITLAVQRSPGSNTIQVVKDIKKILPQFEKELPKGVSLEVVFDRSISIRDSVNEVKMTLFIASLLVILVIFIFLRNVNITLIPAIALPLSIFGTFGFMYYLSYSLNNLTLLALTLVVGFVIDDAIVMLENIARHFERGETPLNAARKGSQEISFTILSMTISLAAVFIPILFMEGIVGRLFREFSVTICVAILLSGFVSLTLTPMMCSRLLQKNDFQKELSWMRWAEKSFEKLYRFYDRSLQYALKHHVYVFGIFLLTIVMSVALFVIIPKGFLPSEDTGQLLAYTETDSSTSFEEMSIAQQKVSAILSENPNVDGVISSVGSGGASGASNTGRLFIRLKPFSERKLSADQIVAELRPALAHVPGIRVFLQNLPSIRMGGGVSKSPYQFTLQDSNLTLLNHWSEIYKAKMMGLPNLTDVTSDLEYTGPQIHVDIDRDKAAAMGITVEQIQNTLYTAFGSKEIASIYTPVDTYDVIAELKSAFLNDQNALSKLYIRSKNGNLVPLSTVVTFRQGSGPMSVTHQGQLPSVTISFALKPGSSLGDAVSDIENLKGELDTPNTLMTSFQGNASAFQSSFQGLGLLLLVAIFVVYVVLGMLYESFIHPFTILSGLPSAGVGALITLLVFHYDLNLYSFIGIIMLIGIVKKNAIMMVDFAITEKRNHGKTGREAIYSACLIRFRPIMMTTLAALVGTLPIVLQWGAGAESRRPLGLVVLGGLIVSQLLTLYITPVIYLYFEKLLTYGKSVKIKETPVIPVTFTQE